MSEKDADGMRCPHYLLTIAAVALTGYESSDDSGDGNGNGNGGSDATATATITATDEPTATETEEPTPESPGPVGEMRAVSNNSGWLENRTYRRVGRERHQHVHCQLLHHLYLRPQRTVELRR